MPLSREERLRVERFAGSWGDGGEDAWVGERGEGEADAVPDGVAGAGVGVDHGFERVGPAGGGVGVVGEDGDGVGGGGGVEGPRGTGRRAVRPSRAAAWRRACSAVRVLPSQKPPSSTPPAESPVAEARPVARIIAVSGSSQPRMGDQRSPAGRRRRGVAGRRWRRGRGCCRAREGGGEVVGSGAGGDDRPGGVQDRGDDDVEAFAGAGWAEEQDGVLDAGPDLRARGRCRAGSRPRAGTDPSATGAEWRHVSTTQPSRRP